MGFEHIDEACLAGQRAENSDFATPSGTAGINPLKIAKRNIYVNFIIMQASTPPGIFPAVKLANAGASSNIFPAMAPRGEISSGEKGTLKIAWATAATVGNLRLVCDMAVCVNGISSLNAAISRNVIQAANTSGSAFSIAKLEFPLSVFNANQLWSLKISRDSANVLDTVADDIYIKAVWMEILGRC